MVSMVILNYNDWELTKQYAQHISSMDAVDHVVIVDNCSPDNSFEKLQPLSSEKINVIKTERNDGYAKGNNYGVQHVIDHYGLDGIIIISNPDIEVEEQSIKQLVNVLESRKGFFAVTGLVFNINNELSPIFTWHLPTVPMLFVNSCTILRNVMFKMFGYGTKVKKDKIDFSQDIIQCEALPGCFFAADLSIWKKLGGFSDKTFLFYEEDILFTKSKKSEMKVALVPSSKIKHLEGVSVKKSLNSWKKREMILQDSCDIYMQDALEKKPRIIRLYNAWNQLWLPERFLFYKIKQRKK